MKTKARSRKGIFYGLLAVLVLLLVGFTILRNIPFRWIAPQISRPESLPRVEISFSRENRGAPERLTITQPEEIAWICGQLSTQKLTYRGPYGGGIPYGGSYGDLLSVRIGEKTVHIRADGTVYTDSSRFTLTKEDGGQFYRSLVSRYFA